MLKNLIRFSIQHRWLVLLTTLALAALGVWNFTRLPIDAVPDITNVQVQINTEALGYTPLEVEQRITAPLELELAGLPRLEYYRSLSRYGLSQITVVFQDGTDLYFARNQVTERLSQVRDTLPDGISPQLAPVATGLGEIFLYTVETTPEARKPSGEAYTPTDLRELHDWVVRPQLRQVPGVVEVNAIGGYEKQFHILPDPQKMLAFRLSFDEIAEAVQANNASRGAGYIERAGEQFLLRAPGQLASLDELRNVVVRTVEGIPLRLGEVAEVAIGSGLRTGAATQRGEEVVLGTAMMLIGQNSRTVSQAVAARLTEVQKSLPAGVKLSAVYDRTTLVDRTIATVEKNLLEGALLVIVVLFALLGNLRAALITAAVIPLTMLLTISGMVRTGTSANLMSMGALDFGLIVDGAVIIVENCLLRFGQLQHQLGRLLTREERFETAATAAAEVIQPALFGVFIITVVYLPIFALTGIEGRMFHPMALTVVLALAAAMVLSLTFVPAMVAMAVTGKVAEHDNVVIATTRRAFAPLLRLAVRARVLVVALAAALAGLGLWGATKLGTEFIPNLDEGDLAVQALRMPGLGLAQSVQMQEQIERELMKVPEVRNVFARTGTAEVATDPMPPSISDGYVILKDRKDWPKPNKPKAVLEREIGQLLEGIPGQNYEISQPIQLRFNELISGVRSDVAVKLYGDDIDTLLKSGNQIAAILGKVSGSRGVKVEQLTGLPTLSIVAKREALARFGIPLATLQDALAAAIAGEEAGLLYEGDRRFSIVVQLPEKLRTDLDALRALPIELPDEAHAQGSSEHAFVPFSELADIVLTEGPNQLSRENGKRRLVVSANVRDRDLGSFISEVQDRIAREIKLPPGYWLSYGGTFQQLESAQQRLQLVVPATLLLIFILLYTAFGSVRDALIVFSGVPLALVGGVAALWLRDIPLSITAAVGFIALSGVAVLNGVVMVSFIRQLLAEGKSLSDAVIDGALARLRPVLMTALVAALGFVPMAINVGPGSEVQRPLATVVIGGIVSSTLLTLLVLPALYRMFGRARAPEVRSGSTSPSGAARALEAP